MSNNEKFNRLLNSCTSPRAIYFALLCLGKAGILDRYRKGLNQGVGVQGGGQKSIDKI